MPDPTATRRTASHPSLPPRPFPRNPFPPAPIPVHGAARRAAALEAADGLTRALVAVTAGLSPSLQPGLGRSLREAAVMVQAGTAAACRSDDPLQALRGLEATGQALRRLGVWLDLAHRFGDLAPAELQEPMPLQARLRVLLQAIAEERRHGGRSDPAGVETRGVRGPRLGMTLDVNNALRYDPSVESKEGRR